MAQTTTNATADTHPGANRLIVGTVLAAITFWLFAQTTLNVAPTVREELRISESLSNIAVSITALFSGIFIVVAGGLANRPGRLKITYLGLALSIVGCQFRVFVRPVSGKNRQHRHSLRSRRRIAVQCADGDHRDRHHRHDRTQR